MKDIAHVILAALLVIGSIVGLGWLLSGNQLALTKFFSPKFEEVRRDTFETSKAYRDGTIQELMALRVEYEKADDKTKPALAGLIRHKAAGFPSDALPRDLDNFILTLP